MTPPAPAARSTRAAVSADEIVKALFHITGPSDPQLLSRLIEPVAKLGHVPARMHASRESGDGSELTVDLRLAAVSRRTASLIEHALRSVVGVSQVIALCEHER